MNVAEDLVGLFGDYLSPEKEGTWQDARARLRAGESVSGEVIASYAFGVFVDIGAGFPALLEVLQFEHAGRRRFAPEDYPAVGDAVTARVVAFSDRNRQIALTQRYPHPYFER
jgi:ribosomal protein S1